MRKELLEGLTEEQVKLFKACKDHKDLYQLAIDEGVELNEEQLEAITGGCDSDQKHKNKKIIED